MNLLVLLWIELKNLKIGNGMDEGVELGPLSTAKRLEEIEKLS